MHDPERVDSPLPAAPTLRGLLSRRALFAAGAALAASRSAGAQSAPLGAHGARAPGLAGDLSRLVARTTYGFRPDVWQEAQALGYQGFLERQLDPASIADAAVDAALAGFPSLAMTSRQIWDTYGLTFTLSVPVSELKQASVLRAALSKRQLLERMVEFWSDHLSIDHMKDECQVLKTADDRDVIRVHALGTFPALLVASAHSGAMLDYLDNRANKVGAPNENYARELLELHTLGVGNYTELDIKELARCLTGWTLRPRSHPEYGAFHFEAAWHDFGSKTVLGVQIPAGGGTSDADQLIAMLAMHPTTARYVGGKLARFLLSYDPPAALLDEVVATWLATGGDIKAIVRVILRPESMALAHVAAQPKLKRPRHLVASLLRAGHAQVSSWSPLVEELETLGQAPFAWLTPDGCPDAIPAWGQALLPRWTFASRFFANEVPGTAVDVAALLGGVPKSAAAARIDAVLSGGALAEADVAALQGWIDSQPAWTPARQREAFALAASCPSFQWY